MSENRDQARPMKVMLTFGTRPEAIKMAPLYHALRQAPERFETCVCVTAQHRQMLDQVLSVFDIVPDIDLDVMKPNQDLFDVTSSVLLGMRDVLAAGRAIAPLLKPGNILILESTSPVGTTEQIAAVIAEAGVDTSRIHIAYCPERVLPGRIMVELTENARIVGGLTPEAAKIAGDFYRGFVAGDVLETDARTAEMCKLVENSFRDVNIAFANELSLLCAKLGIDVWQLIGLANRHPRVNVLQPGVGVGGHCIAVDPWFIVAGNPEQSKLIRTARLVNTGKTDWVIEQISARAEAEKARLGRPARVACLGLAFKPNIDDLRESPAIEVAHALIAKGLDLVAVEPNVTQCDGIALADFDTALEQADIVTVLVNHREFNTPAVTERLKALGAMDFCGAL